MKLLRRSTSWVRPQVVPARARSMSRRVAAAALAAALAVAGGCGDDADSTADAGPAVDAAGDTPPAPIFAVSGSVYTPADGVFNPWLALFPEITSDIEIDLGTTIAPGPGGFEVPGDGTVIWKKQDSPEMERFRVQDDYTLVSEGTLSFAAFGLGNTSSHPSFYISATKAYLVDRFNGQIIIWNPQTYEIESSFPLDGFARDGMSLNIGFLQVVGDRLVLLARYTRLSDETWAPLAVAGFVDTETNVVTYDEDTRCGNAVYGALASNGDIYFGSFVGAATATYAGAGGDPAVTPCQLRIAAGAREIDDAYFLDLTAVAGSDLVAGPVQGLGDTAYYLVYDNSVVPVGDGVTSDDLFFAESWRIHAATYGDEQDTLAAVPGLAPTAGYFFGAVFAAKNRDPVPLLVQFAGDFSSTTLTDISDPAEFRPFLTTPGVFGNVAQVR